MTKNWNYKELDAFGRIRLSKNFYMREFLHSEIAQIYGLVNAPDNPDLAIQAGSQLCKKVLEPIAQAWGKVHVRSGYRSPEVNQTGNKNKLNCASNANNAAAHIWDHKDASGCCGATACIVIPAYQDYFDKTGDWMSLAWWINHHVPDYFNMCFFKEQCAFNIRWYGGSDGSQTIKSYLANPDTGDKTALINKGREHPLYESIPPAKRFAKAAKLIG